MRFIEDCCGTCQHWKEDFVMKEDFVLVDNLIIGECQLCSNIDDNWEVIEQIGFIATCLSERTSGELITREDFCCQKYKREEALLK